jgi:hypothetical protein
MKKTQMLNVPEKAQPIKNTLKQSIKKQTLTASKSNNPTETETLGGANKDIF